VVADRTGISIITIRIVVLMRAADTRHAGIIRADVAIVTIQLSVRHTFALTALLTAGARVTIIAELDVGNLGTTRIGVTGLICTGIRIVAVRGHARLANTRYAEVINGARITIRAGTAVIGGNQTASPGCRLTGRGQARCIETLRLGTGNYRVLLQRTLIGQLAQVTEEGPVALVSILQCTTVRVVLAITRHRHASAHIRFALVGHGTRIAIVTFGHIGFVYAATRFITRVVGTRVVVVTINLLSYADSRFAVVSNCARVTVLAFITVQSQMVTSRLTQAEIFSAVIIVVAKLP